MSIKLKGSSDGSVSFDAPADTSPSGSDITLTLPTSAGSANQFLKNSGIAGELEYSSMVEDSSGRLLVGTTTAGANGGDELTVTNSGQSSCGITIRAATDGASQIYFADGTSGTAQYQGIIGYNHASDEFRFNTNYSGSSATRMVLDSEGRLLIGTTSTTNAKDYADDLVIGSLSGDRGMTIVSATNKSGSINFSDGVNSGGASFKGIIQYNHNSNYMRFYTDETERIRIQSTGYTQFGGYLNGTGSHRLNGINATQGNALLVISGYQLSGGSSQDTAIWYAVNTGGSVSSSGAGVRMYKNTGTNRSINTAGTINASGADYAEYMTKAGDFTLAKGDICGINSEGKLTNVFADAISFVVKSTDPSYVGGDTWHETVGEEPGGYEDTRTEEEIAAAKVVYEEALEAARQLVDRIAFSGQVPVNVTGATPGQHIIPTAAADGSIEGTAKAEADLTMAEYMSSVGKVIAIEDDGRAKIIVKVA